MDIWAIGVLATQLLAGLCAQVDSVELLGRFARSPGNMKEPSDELDQIFDDIERIQYECIDDAKSFIRRCLQVNPVERMTAAEALRHSWLCEPDDDHKLFLRRELEITAGWKHRGVLGQAVKEIPGVRQLEPDVSPYFPSKERKIKRCFVRYTAEDEEETSNKDEIKKRSLLQGVMMLPQNQDLMQRWRELSTVPSTKAQQQLMKTLEESGKLFVPKDMDGDVGMSSDCDGDVVDRPRKRTKA